MSWWREGGHYSEGLLNFHRSLHKYPHILYSTICKNGSEGEDGGEEKFVCLFVC